MDLYEKEIGGYGNILIGGAELGIFNTKKKIGGKVMG